MKSIDIVSLGDTKIVDSTEKLKAFETELRRRLGNAKLVSIQNINILPAPIKSICGSDRIHFCLFSHEESDVQKLMTALKHIRVFEPGTSIYIEYVPTKEIDYVSVE